MKTIAVSITLLISLLAGTGIATAANVPTTITGATTVDADAAYRLFRQGALFVDVRKPKGYDMGRVPGAVSLPLHGGFDHERLGALASTDDKLVIYCGGPRNPLSARAVEKAVSWGYRSVYFFRDGLPGWQKAGYPVE